MQIKISTRHGHLSEETQKLIRDKADKINHLFPRLMMIEVLVDIKDDEKFVEILVTAEHKHDFVASDRNKDLLAAVDLAVDKLKHQVHKYKEKVQDRRRTPSAGEVAGSLNVDETDGN